MEEREREREEGRRMVEGWSERGREGRRVEREGGRDKKIRINKERAFERTRVRTHVRVPACECNG